MSLNFPFHPPHLSSLTHLPPVALCTFGGISSLFSFHFINFIYRPFDLYWNFKFVTFIYKFLWDQAFFCSVFWPPKFTLILTSLCQNTLNAPVLSPLGNSSVWSICRPPLDGLCVHVSGLVLLLADIPVNLSSSNSSGLVWRCIHPERLCLCLSLESP